MISIINYGIGNAGSILNMLRICGLEARIVDQPKDLEDASALILPGVGSYDYGAIHIRKFSEVLEKKVINEGLPFLGICLGMQLLFLNSEEGKHSGLGWIDGYIKRFDFSFLNNDQKRLNVPHMGWNRVEPIADSKIKWTQQPNLLPKFYFSHSFHPVDVPNENKLATCKYGYSFTCAVHKKNIYGVQFHPEKSHKFGKKLFQDFFSLTK